jgi:NADH-quinone oxidoreductase subunit E
MSDYTTIIDSYKDKPGGIIEAYHGTAKEYNYIPEDAITAAAEAFGMSPAQAYGSGWQLFIPILKWDLEAGI